MLILLLQNACAVSGREAHSLYFLLFVGNSFDIKHIAQSIIRLIHLRHTYISWWETIVQKYVCVCVCYLFLLTNCILNVLTDCPNILYMCIVVKSNTRFYKSIHTNSTNLGKIPLLFLYHCPVRTLLLLKLLKKCLIKSKIIFQELHIRVFFILIEWKKELLFKEDVTNFK